MCLTQDKLVNQEGKKEPVMYLLRLPSSLWFIIRHYLTIKEFHEFLNVSILSEWKQLKKECVYLSLNTKCSLLYLTSLEFRKKIQSQLSNPLYQVGLMVKLDGLREDNTEILLPAHDHNSNRGIPYHSLEFIHSKPKSQKPCSINRFLEVLQANPRMESLTISKYYSFNELSNRPCSDHSLMNLHFLGNLCSLKQLKELHVKNCYYLKDFTGLQSSRITKLHLTGMKLHQMEALQANNCFNHNYLQHVILENCHLTSLKGLTSLAKLELKQCYGLKDISALQDGAGNHHTKLQYLSLEHSNDYHHNIHIHHYPSQPTRIPELLLWNVHNGNNHDLLQNKHLLIEKLKIVKFHHLHLLKKQYCHFELFHCSPAYYSFANKHPSCPISGNGGMNAHGPTQNASHDTSSTTDDFLKTVTLDNSEIRDLRITDRKNIVLKLNNHTRIHQLLIKNCSNITIQVNDGQSSIEHCMIDNCHEVKVVTTNEEPQQPGEQEQPGQATTATKKGGGQSQVNKIHFKKISNWQNMTWTKHPQQEIQFTGCETYSLPSHCQ